MIIIAWLTIVSIVFYWLYTGESQKVRIISAISNSLFCILFQPNISVFFKCGFLIIGIQVIHLLVKNIFSEENK